jgi:hypothetical protein
MQFKETVSFEEVLRESIQSICEQGESIVGPLQQVVSDAEQLFIDSQALDSREFKLAFNNLLYFDKDENEFGAQIAELKEAISAILQQVSGEENQELLSRVTELDNALVDCISQVGEYVLLLRQTQGRELSESSKQKDALIKSGRIYRERLCRLSVGDYNYVTPYLELYKDIDNPSKLTQSFMSNFDNFITQLKQVDAGIDKMYCEAENLVEYIWQLDRLVKIGYMPRDHFDRVRAHENAHVNVADKYGAFQKYRIRLNRDSDTWEVDGVEAVVDNEKLTQAQSREVAIAPLNYGAEIDLDGLSSSDKWSAGHEENPIIQNEQGQWE